ncbi:MAG: hypothetical protein LKH74_10625 [Levilactobacillus sp.]|jgi:hypothetical protein|uniref:hypothetical protein n=1 Tax=Levilactobacillus sp. TaxID=2767919 RepID=UPI0025827CD3|nr:hypothetical protein [Levilactobacillus sp.]MCI1554363.1 hypothetical protein [Levilactobacillus sp.]MCI1598306.1 hypothetical protein [Levilactobacillus sp.]MCI1605352.1 hypothetical protein [Levilactobacillus sp.]
MGKFSKVAMTAMLVLLVGGAVPTTASAATWHKGTPKALRGNWKRSYNDRGSKVTIHFRIKSKSMDISRPGWAVESWSNLKYRKVGAGTYKIKGTYRNGGMLAQKNSHMKVKKSHSKVTYKNSWSKSYSYLGWFHK